MSLADDPIAAVGQVAVVDVDVDVDVDGDASGVQRSRRSWQVLGLIGAVLLVAFAGVAWVQSRTLALLEQSVADRTHSLTFAFGQLENEYLRLTAALQRQALAPGSQAGEDLMLRHELFVSRIRQVGEGDPDLMQLIGHAGDPVHEALQAYVERADPVIGEGAGAAAGPAAVRQLLQWLAPLAEPLHGLANDAYHHDAETAGRRDTVVRTQHRVAVALTVFQSLLTLVFAAVVVRQLRSAEHRRRRLERLAAALREAQAAAESASRAKSAFVANMSHELRTPFHGLLGMLSLIEDGSLSAEQQRRLQTARRSGDHLLSILNDVLDLSRLEAGEFGIQPADTAVRRLFDDVLALMRPQAQQRGLALRLTVDPDLPERLRVDGKRLRQILFNLIGNGLKFTPQGEVHIDVSWRPGAVASAPSWCVDVTDTGMGMDAAVLARLFQRFAQGDASIQRRFGGTGLGLEISRTLARNMGGDLTATSVPGQGSRFSLVLPAEPVEPTLSVAAGVSTEVSTALATALPDGVADAGAAGEPLPMWPRLAAAAGPTPGTLRALVCDDNPVNRLVMQAYLARCGCESVLCDDGAQAVALARCNAFDLIVMDVHMPGLDGLSATRQIRALRADEGAPVIVMVTADPLDEMREQAAQAGVDELLAKPVSLGDVQASLRQQAERLARPGAQEPAGIAEITQALR